MKIGNWFIISLVMTASLISGMTESSSVKQQLFNAVEAGDYALVQELLASGADVNARDFNGVTPLHKASESGCLGMLQLLINKGADSTFEDSLEMKTALEWAVKYNRSAIVEYFLDNLTAFYPDLLSYAVFYNNKELVTLFIKRKIDINAKDKDNMTALHYAALVGNKDIAQLLLDHGADINALADENETPLHKAAAMNEMHDAVKGGFFAAVAQLLLEKGADSNAQNSANQSPLAIAAQKVNGQYMVEVLLSYSAQVPPDLLANNVVKQAQDTRQRLFEAKTFKAIAQMLAQGAYDFPLVREAVNSKRKELFEAIANDDISCVSKLLKEGFTLNTCDKNGNTLLHKAIESRNLKIIDLLLSLGVHEDKYLYKANRQGFTPLQLLAAHGIIASVFTPRQSEHQNKESVSSKRKQSVNQEHN